MKSSIRKLKNKIGKSVRDTAKRANAKKKSGARALRNSVKKSMTEFMDRSKDFIGTLPTAAELREEFADWHSFEPIALNELESI